MYDVAMELIAQNIITDLLYNRVPFEVEYPYRNVAFIKTPDTLYVVDSEGVKESAI